MKPTTPEGDSQASRRRRILVAVHQLDLGGSQMNAVDLACEAADRGHDVMVAGPDGPLVDVLRERGVRHMHIQLDNMDRAAPSYRRLAELTRMFRPDIVHAYELTPALLAFFGPHRSDRVPMTMTINSMSVPDFMPGSVPLQVCNPVIAASVRPRSGPVGVLEIPTDCVGQYPDFPSDGFRAEIGAADNELLVVVVSRFARVLKQQGLETAIRAAGRVAARHPVRLVLVGDGPAMPDLRALADETNARVGREVVVLTGMRPDPRSAYAAADVVLGMGGSLLRAMAFGKPCVVQGEHGFFRILDAGSAREFRWRGFYGIGGGGTGEDTLVQLLDRLLGDESLRKENADFALALVRQFYSLEHAIELQLDWYERVLAEFRPSPPLEFARTATAVSAWIADRAVKRRRGIAQEDYFNSAERIQSGFVSGIPDWFDPEPVR
ncbi:glycosyltransferase [Pseudonocardia aurantiaca]|uniref:Glycosyltransferase n=1 Tax=Pseudonocardia aurantiaca TaxID=75290 RepID=A0ABW4FPR3_9PSEU